MANLPKATRLHIDPVSIDYTGRPNYSTGPWRPALDDNSME